MTKNEDKAGSPSSPERSGESASKSGVGRTTEEHFNRIKHGMVFGPCVHAAPYVSTCPYCRALESLTALRERIAELEQARSLVVELRSRVRTLDAVSEDRREQIAELQRAALPFAKYIRARHAAVSVHSIAGYPEMRVHGGTQLTREDWDRIDAVLDAPSLPTPANPTDDAPGAKACQEKSDADPS